MEIGYGPGTAEASDETTFGPLVRISGAVSSYTTNTVNDTFSCTGTFSFSSEQTINNIGLFNVGTTPPFGVILNQVNPTDTQIVVSGYNNFPGSFPFSIQVLSEVMTVVSGNGTNTWNVIRASNGSSLSFNPTSLPKNIDMRI